MIGIATLLLGIGIVVPPGLEVRAVTTISQIGSDIDGETADDNSGYSVAMSADGSRIAIGAPGNDDNAGHVRIYTWNGTTWTQTGDDINGEAAGDNSGYSVAMSADGTRIAIGAIFNDDNGVDSGQVRLYTWNGTTWTQTGDDINGETAGDQSGYSVAMSADGTRIAIGARYNDVDSGNIVNDTGHVRIYSWDGTTWMQTGDDINGEAEDDRSGYSVAMAANGNRIAIGAIFNNNITGHVRIYTWDGTTWTQTGADINGEADGEYFGSSVAMSADGSRIAIGAIGNNDNGGDAGQVRIYIWNGTTWTQTGDDINGETTNDQSGYSVAMSADGSRIAIGALYNDDNGNDAGQVRVLGVQDSPDVPTITGQIGSDIDGETADDKSGYSVAMSADGSRVAIGAPHNDDNGNDAGQVRIYTWNGTTWTQTGDDINGETASNGSGWSVAMSADGSRIAIGAPYNDDNGDAAGHVRIYTWDGTTWMQTGADINGETAGDYSGWSVAMSADGSRIAIGAPGYEYSESDSAGQVRIYSVPAAPTAPTISSVIAANGSLTVAFTAGTDGGSPITNYKYSIDGTNYVALNPAATTSPFTISGLTNGTSYSVSIKAVNEIGDSIASNAVAGIPVAPTATTTTTVALIATVPVLETVKKADSLPKTGDNSSRVVMIGLLFTMTGLVLTSRRRIKQ
jgi:LPXTG-motif cell wall-anchored protein